MKFVIVSNRQAWGGTIALHALCKYISEEGYDARIFNYFNLANVPEKGLWPKLKHKLKYIYFFVRDIALKTAVKFLDIMPYKERIRNLPKLRGYVDVPVEGCRRKYFPFFDDDTIVVYPEVIRLSRSNTW